LKNGFLDQLFIAHKHYTLLPVTSPHLEKVETDGVDSEWEGKQELLKCDFNFIVCNSQAPKGVEFYLKLVER